MISSLGNMNAFTYSTISSAGTGKLYVPVSQNSLLYSHFSHVSGVAAKNDQSGVSISKIRILNSLIENLTNAKTASVENTYDNTNNKATIKRTTYKEDGYIPYPQEKQYV